jgi:ankyrin repeat protein
LPISWAFAARKLDIASLLISRGAAIDDVSLKGWSPHFYLFGGLETSQRPAEAHSAIGPCTQYLEALNCASYQEYNMQDDLGWTGMHRAAIYGTAADIEALIKYGASSLPRTKRLQWSPIFMAVYYSNISTFRALSTHRQGYVLERDIRGWTLLHVAAASGCGEIIEQLLQDGADVHARGDARAQCVPDGLRGYPVTPLDVALDAGVNAQSAFVQAVAAHDRQVKILEDGNEKDLFWVAEEGISTGS